MFRRFRYLFQFIKSDKKTRNKNPYYDMRRDGEDGVIPFVLPYPSLPYGRYF